MSVEYGKLGNSAEYGAMKHSAVRNYWGGKFVDFEGETADVVSPLDGSRLSTNANAASTASRSGNLRLYSSGPTASPFVRRRSTSWLT